MEQDRRDKVMSIRLTSEQYEKVKELARQKYICPSILGRVLVELYLREEVRI